MSSLVQPRSQVPSTPSLFHAKSLRPQVSSIPSLFDAKSLRPQVSLTPSLFDPSLFNPVLFDPKSLQPSVFSTPSLFDPKSLRLPTPRNTPTKFFSALRADALFQVSEAPSRFYCLAIKFLLKMMICSLCGSGPSFQASEAQPQFYCFAIKLSLNNNDSEHMWLMGQIPGV